MRISTDALPKHLEPALIWIGGLIGAAVDKRVAAFEQEAGESDFAGGVPRIGSTTPDMLWRI